MKVIYNKYIPFKGFLAINLFGYFFVREEYKDRLNGYQMKKMINHESIHTAQMKELGYIFFYLLYILEFIIRLPLNFLLPNDAYMAISFEREAYTYEQDFEYLKKRKPYSWLKHIFKRSRFERRFFKFN